MSMREHPAWKSLWVSWLDRQKLNASAIESSGLAGLATNKYYKLLFEEEDDDDEEKPNGLC